MIERRFKKQNLLLLQKIQNAKPSTTVAKGFTPPAISAAALQQNGKYFVSSLRFQILLNVQAYLP